MSKLQLLYEKLMRIAYIFGAIFFALSLIDFSAAMMTGAFSCSSGTCGIGDSYPFFKITLIPLIVATVVFIITGFVFFKLAHKESDLLSVSDYKKTLQEQDSSEDVISREDLYEKLKRGNRKVPVQKENPIKKFFATLSANKKERIERKRIEKENRQKITAEEKAKQAEQERIDNVRVEKEKQERAKTKLNKTALILLLSKETNLSQNNARLFLNAFLETVKDKVIADEEVKISKFGRFTKVHVKAHTEIDPVTNNEIKVDEHNTVDFFAYKPFLELLNAGEVVEESPEEVLDKPVETIEQTEPVQEELVQEEPKQEEPVQEDSVQEEIIEEGKDETVQEAPIRGEILEEVQVQPTEKVEEEQQHLDLEPEPEVVAEPVVEKQVEVQEEKQPEKPAVKPSKPKPAVRTKKQIIELMDETTDLSKNKANKFLKFFAEVVKEQLIKRDDVELEGIGFFTTIEMPAKEAVNPQTNEKIIVPAHHQVRLRFDDELKDKMNQ